MSKKGQEENKNTQSTQLILNKWSSFTLSSTLFLRPCLTSALPMQVLAVNLGILNSHQLSREALLRVLLETEQLAELAFPEPPSWNKFSLACKKKLGKHLTFEYHPFSGGGADGIVGGVRGAGGTGGITQSPRGIHVKDSQSMKKCMDWLLLQPRPGELLAPSPSPPQPSDLSPAAPHALVSSESGDSTTRGAVDNGGRDGIGDDGDVSQNAKTVEAKREREMGKSHVQHVISPVIVLPCVLAVELMPSEEDANKV